MENCFALPRVSLRAKQILRSIQLSPHIKHINCTECNEKSRRRWSNLRATQLLAFPPSFITTAMNSKSHKFDLLHGKWIQNPIKNHFSLVRAHKARLCVVLCSNRLRVASISPSNTFASLDNQRMESPRSLKYVDCNPSQHDCKLLSYEFSCSVPDAASAQVNGIFSRNFNDSAQRARCSAAGRVAILKC